MNLTCLWCNMCVFVGDPWHHTMIRCFRRMDRSSTADSSRTFLLLSPIAAFLRKRCRERPDFCYVVVLPCCLWQPKVFNPHLARELRAGGRLRGALPPAPPPPPSTLHSAAENDFVLVSGCGEGAWGRRIQAGERCCFFYLYVVCVGEGVAFRSKSLDYMTGQRSVFMFLKLRFCLPQSIFLGGVSLLYTQFLVRFFSQQSIL